MKPIQVVYPQELTAGSQIQIWYGDSKNNGLTNIMEEVVVRRTTPGNVICAEDPTKHVKLTCGPYFNGMELLCYVSLVLVTRKAVTCGLLAVIGREIYVQEVWDMIIVMLVLVVGEALLMLKMMCGVNKWEHVKDAVVWPLLAVNGVEKINGVILLMKQVVKSQIHSGLIMSISIGSMNGSVKWDGKHIV